MLSKVHQQPTQKQQEVFSLFFPEINTLIKWQAYGKTNYLTRNFVVLNVYMYLLLINLPIVFLLTKPLMIV